MPAAVERLADRRHLAIHHSAGPDDVRAGVCIGDRSLRQQGKRGVVVHFSIGNHTAVAVARVLAKTDVRGEDQRHAGLAERPQRRRHRPTGVGRAAAFLVLAVWDSEQQDAAHPELRKLASFRDGPVGAQPRVPRQRADGL